MECRSSNKKESGGLNLRGVHLLRLRSGLIFRRAEPTLGGMLRYGETLTSDFGVR